MTEPRWKNVAPGLYLDQSTNQLHLYAEELLESAGYPVTASNLQAIELAARSVLPRMFPGVPVVVVDGDVQ